MKKPANFKWTKNNCKIEALKYNHKKDFKKESKGAYPAALNNGWIDDICSHMIPLGNKHKRMIYRFIFTDNYFYVGLTCDSNRRKNEHLKKNNSAVYKHMKETNLIPLYEELTDYLEVEDAQLQEKYWKNKSESEGYISLNSAKTGALGDCDIFWIKSRCHEEALKYKSRNEFHINSSSAYNSAYKNDWLDEICSHMVSKYKKWNNKEICRIEALKYKTRYDYFI